MREECSVHYDDAEEFRIASEQVVLGGLRRADQQADLVAHRLQQEIPVLSSALKWCRKVSG